MKKTISALLAVIMLISVLALGGCTQYKSSYTAIGLATTNENHSASMSFGSFEGTQVFMIQSEGGLNGKIMYSAKLGKGRINVYYDYDGTKTPWFSIDGGEDVDSYTKLSAVAPLNIIVETDGECEDGLFYFESK